MPGCPSSSDEAGKGKQAVATASLASPVEHGAGESCTGAGNWECETRQIRKAI